MLRKADENERQRILDFLSKDIENCLYLYLDIYWYGLDGDIVKVWYCGEADDYSLIVMKYQNCFQIYSPNNGFDKAELRQFADNESIDRLFARKDTIDTLLPIFSDGFFSEYGSVVEIKKYRAFEKEFPLVEVAGVEDLPELASLILLDEENSKSYSYDEMLNMLNSLYETGLGRSYVIKDDGRIVASSTISAESDRFLIGAYTIVHPDYRSTLYGVFIDSFLCNVVRGEKRLFGFMMDERRIRMFKAHGNAVAAEYGKLIRVS